MPRLGTSHHLSYKFIINIYCRSLKFNGPVAIRDILPNKVGLAITRLYFFFNAICSKVIDPVKLDELENEVAIILC